MTDVWLKLLGLVGVLLAAGLIQRELPRARARWAIRRAAPLDSSVPESAFVRVTGTVRAHEATVVAPLSGRECVVVRSRLRLRMRYNDRVYETFATAPFVLTRDGGGDVLVDAKYIRLALTPVKTLGDLKRKESLLAEHRLNRAAAGRAWFEEVVVEAGQRVSIAGTLMFEPGGPEAGERDFRSSPRLTARLTGDVEHPVVLGPAVEAAPPNNG